jgi:23S rRNA-intervening sequence protein
MQDFRNLKVWQRSHQLVLWTYRITADFPREETFGLKALDAKNLGRYCGSHC